MIGVGHTPGPWFAGRLIGDEEGGPVISVGPFDFWDRPDRRHHYEDTICEVWDNGNLSGSAEANARLIAAAPEMAEALRAVVRFKRGIGEYNFASLSSEDRGIASLEAWEAIEERIDALLAKIGGEA